MQTCAYQQPRRHRMNGRATQCELLSEDKIVAEMTCRHQAEIDALSKAAKAEIALNIAEVSSQNDQLIVLLDKLTARVDASEAKRDGIVPNAETGL